MMIFCSEPTNSHPAWAERASPWWSWQIPRQLEHWPMEELSPESHPDKSTLSPFAFMAGYFVLASTVAGKLLHMLLRCCVVSPVYCTYIFIYSSQCPWLRFRTWPAHCVGSRTRLSLTRSPCFMEQPHSWKYVLQINTNPGPRSPSLYKVNLHSYRHLIL